MRILKHISSFALVLSMWINLSNAQAVRFTVCAGDTGITYAVEGSENSSFEWKVEGGDIVQDLGDTIIVDWLTIPGEYNITVQETNEFGCMGPMQTATVVVTGPSIELGDDADICAGEVYSVVPVGEFESILWQDGSTTPVYQTGVEGWITAVATDENGCSQSDSMYLSVHELPEVDIGPDTILCGEEGLILDAGPDGEFYTWSTGAIEQVTTVFMNDGPEVWVEVETAYGCVNSDTLSIERCNLQFYFRDIPTAITPNGDGKNDIWELDKLQAFTQAVVEIYNQWGILVWKSEPGYSNPWDGRDFSGSLVPVDSYHFVITFNDDSGEHVSGIVTVIQ